MPLCPALLPFRLLPFTVIAFAALNACSGQGEGELCNPKAGNNGNDDCQSGLVCDTSQTHGLSLGRCCPQDRSRATTAVCSSNSGALDASPTPPDASPAEASTGEASADALVESAAEPGTGSDGSDAATE